MRLPVCRLLLPLLCVLPVLCTAGDADPAFEKACEQLAKKMEQDVRDADFKAVDSLWDMTEYTKRITSINPTPGAGTRSFMAGMSQSFKLMSQLGPRLDE